MKVLVTGATGYIGGRLVPRLLALGREVRCVARDAGRLEAHAWPGVEIVQADLSEPGELPQVLAGVEVAYYLVHSMAVGQAFRERDHAMALAFGKAAREAGVRRIIYLGGLGDPERVKSKHLISRQEVGRALAEGGVPVIEFRAAVIVGSGSASFEMIRHLAERLPVMVTPTWVNTRWGAVKARAEAQALTGPAAPGGSAPAPRPAIGSGAASRPRSPCARPSPPGAGSRTRTWAPPRGPASR